MATMLFTASCQQEELVKQPQAGDLAKVSIKVTTPELGTATRAFGDGKSAKVLHYAVYNVKNDNGQETLTYLPELTKEDHEINITTTVDLQLVTGNTYKVIFWADNANSPYTTNWTDANNPTVTVDYDYNNGIDNGVTCNNENYDAFFNWMTIDVDAAKTVDIDLFRPFAQLNIGTSDIVEASKAGYTLQKTQVTVKAYQTLNLWGKTVSDPTNVTFNAADYPNYDANADYGLKASNADGYEKFPVTGYEYMAMNYLLCPEDKELVDVEFDFFADNREAKKRKYASVPVRRNWRTNIYGQLITSDVDVKVEIIPGFDNAYNKEVWDGHTLTAPHIEADGTIVVGQGSDLAYIANVLNGGDQSNAANSRTRAGSEDYTKAKIVLTNNIDLGGENWNPIRGFKGVFDGNGFTISNLNVSTEAQASAGLFADLNGGTVKNLTVKDAEIKGHYKSGVIVGDGLCARIEKCAVENAKIVVTPFNNDDANHVGGIVGYLSGESVAYVKDCSVKNAEITAYRDVAGVVGTANQTAEVTGNTVANVKVTAERRCEYVEEKAYNVGAVVGRVHEKATVESNTATEVTLEVYEKNGVEIKNGVYYVSNHSELAYVLGLNLTGEVSIIFDGDVEGNVTEIQKPGRKLTIDGKEHSFNGYIKVHSNSYHYADAALTVKKVNFTTSVASTNFIEALENGSERYSTNITVENCTFTATGEAENTAVGVQIKASKNAKVIGCKANNMHSLIQAQSCDETVFVQNCTVNGKNGVAFKQVKAATVEGTTITATGYGIRFDGNTDNYGITVKNNEVTAVQPFIVRKMTGKNNTITLEGENTLTATGTDQYQIVITNGSDDAKYGMPTGTYTLYGADSYLVYPREVFVSSTQDINEALSNGQNVHLEDDIKVAKSDAGSNGYGATGISQLNGGVIDGNGHNISVDAWGTWDSAINTTGGTIRNLNVTGGMRGIFVNHNSKNNDKVILENVKVEGTVYTISCDQGTEKGLEAYNSTFNGWTSYAATIGNVKFDGCSFGKGQGYAYCRPYAPTEFVNCNFAEGYELDAVAAVTFENCTIGGVALTAENLSKLVTGNIANATVK